MITREDLERKVEDQNITIESLKLAFGVSEAENLDLQRKIKKLELIDKRNRQIIWHLIDDKYLLKQEIINLGGTLYPEVIIESQDKRNKS